MSLIGAKQLVIQNKVLVAILVLVSFFIFFRISHVDMVGDDAHYSVRSIGMVDLMFAKEQPSPIFWYEHLPGWTRLSWHDHPIILFLIQHLFFKLHISNFFAKLPYALMSLGTVVITYAWIKKLFDQRVAEASAILLGLNAHFIWYGRTALMENGVLFFISLAWYYFIRFLDNPKDWWKFGLFLGLLLEVKFTTLFIFPTFLVYVVIKKRQLFKDRRLYYAGLTALLLASPVIIYNLTMYRDRGHFAYQLARLFNQSASPWIASGLSANIGAGIGPFFISLGKLISFPYLLLFLAAIIYTIIWRRDALLLHLGLLLFFIEDRLIGAHDLYSMFIAPLVGLAAIDFYRKVRNHQPVFVRPLVVAACFMLGYLIFFIITSHLISGRFGTVGWIYSEQRSDNFGSWQLDSYLDRLEQRDSQLGRFDQYETFKIRSPQLAKYLLNNVISYPSDDVLQLKKIIIFDQNVNWFAQVWLFARRGFYHDLAIFSTVELPPEKRALLAPTTIYFIKATEYAALDSKPKFSTVPAELEKALLAANVRPNLILRDDGQVAFKIYTITDSDIIKQYGFSQSK